VVVLKLHFMYFILDLLSLKHFAFKVVSTIPTFGQLSSLLIHQNHIIRKEHAQRDTTFYASCDLMDHRSKKIRTQGRHLMQFYINWKVICVSVTCSDTCHNIINLSYISLMRVMCFVETFYKARHMTFLDILQ
jgi:hypothetical protein